jgi:CspA family cold shock protein
MQGKVKWYNSRKGYGYIKCEETQTDVFFHHSDFQEPNHLLQEELPVTFEVESSDRGPRAINISRV